MDAHDCGSKSAQATPATSAGEAGKTAAPSIGGAVSSISGPRADEAPEDEGRLASKVKLPTKGPSKIDVLGLLASGNPEGVQEGSEASLDHNRLQPLGASLATVEDPPPLRL